MTSVVTGHVAIDARRLVECVDDVPQGLERFRREILRPLAELFEGRTRGLVDRRLVLLEFGRVRLATGRTLPPVVLEEFATRRTRVGGERGRRLRLSIPGLFLRFADVIVVRDVAIDCVENCTIDGRAEQGAQGVAVHRVIPLHDSHKIMSEIVGVDRFIDARLLGATFQQLPHRLVVPRFAHVSPPVIRIADEQPRIRVILTGMGILPIADILASAEERALATPVERPLEAVDFVVQIEIASLTINVLQPERLDGSDSLPGVDQEFQQRAFAISLTGVPQRLDIGLSEHVLFVVSRGVIDVIDEDFVGINAEIVIAIERAARALIRRQCLLGEPAIVVEAIDPGIEVLSRTLEQIDAAFEAQSEGGQIGVDRPRFECLDATVGIAPLVADGLTIDGVGPLAEGIAFGFGECAVIDAGVDALEFGGEFVSGVLGHLCREMSCDVLGLSLSLYETETIPISPNPVQGETHLPTPTSPPADLAGHPPEAEVVA